MTNWQPGKEMTPVPWAFQRQDWARLRAGRSVADRQAASEQVAVSVGVQANACAAINFAVLGEEIDQPGNEIIPRLAVDDFPDLSPALGS
jgi:hypothetical protein